ncbi:phosphotransferase [Paenibacillus radicis (ex Xue et al. 2023)]|uniref:Phosphotransferase n=1 Tax=Paenibacillus radicis (ex Xue et al. 2023) TaxID=2972489 RepID=A0ABT1YK33_9BACL|nr:phosphotransferase [Paenibacillus radicis (ex Xue et al. 2023)]MCR8633534.1 phosphotransferase [Paenibacillus radicis (ex Xue et al. 2023)]
MAVDLEAQIHAVLEQYFDDTNWSIEAKESGVNNTTRFVNHGNHKFVLRIYENHTDLNKVRFEYSLLQKLQTAKLAFQIPKPVQALNGEYYVLTPSGKISILFEYMEGKRAVLSDRGHVASIGRSMGALVSALENITMDLEAAYEPYYDLFEIHPLVTREKLAAWLLSKQEGSLTKEAELLEYEINNLLDNLSSLQQLPTQLVHSDLVAGNVLTGEEEVSAVIDFEFVTPDLRVMDAAVFINEIIRYHSDRWDLIEAFINGYAETGTLNTDEIQALPQLILLRSIVLCLHFLGRQWAGIDLIHTEEKYLKSYADVHHWMSDNKERILKLCYLSFEQEVSE